jgi:hypothetical protein
VIARAKFFERSERDRGVGIGRIRDWRDVVEPGNFLNRAKNDGLLALAGFLPFLAFLRERERERGLVNVAALQRNKRSRE